MQTLIFGSSQNIFGVTQEIICTSLHVIDHGKWRHTFGLCFFMCPNSICSSLNHANMLQVYQIQQPNHYKNNKKKYKMLTKSLEPTSDPNNSDWSRMNIQNTWSAITNCGHEWVISRNHRSSSKALWHMIKVTILQRWTVLHFQHYVLCCVGLLSL